jgi:hypothetical protein
LTPRQRPMRHGFSGCTAYTLLAYWRALPIKKLEETS